MTTKTNQKQNNDSTTKQATLFLINKLSGRIGKTQLVKLLFLADLQYYKLTEKQLTDLTYQFHQFGPYDKKIDSYIKELKKENLVEEKVESRNDEGYYFRYRAIVPNTFNELDVNSYAILDEIAEQYGRLTLESLLDIVYSLIKKYSRGEIINFKNLI